LELCALDDYDTTYFNGEVVGSTDQKNPEAWGVQRVYRVPARLVRAGKNVLTIRVWDRFGGGGIMGPAQNMFLRPLNHKEAVTSYHRDYRTDFELGDDPFRYFRW